MEEDIFKKFAENAKKIKKVKEDFNKCLNAEIIELELSIKKLFNDNEQLHIFNELSKLDINSISVPKVGRLQTMLDYISKEYLNKYKLNFIATHVIKEIPEPPKKPETKTDKKLIEDFNADVKKWQEDVKKIKEWNTKVHTLTEYLESIDVVDLYGDISLNIDKIPYVYFKFFNTDIDEIEIFMQELKTCAAPTVKKIKTIRIEDISSKLPTFLKSANEVRVYFDTDKEADELYGSKDYVESVYEKYVIKNDTMRKDGGEWGMYNKRKNNLSSPVIGNFSMNTIPTPVNLNSGDDDEVEDDFYNVDYEVDLSDCYFSKVDNNLDENIFAIVPKTFWEKHGTVLANKDMFIIGISDNKKWRKSDIYFKYLGDEREAEEYLEINTENNTELFNYLNNSNTDELDEDTSSIGAPKFFVDLKTANEVIKQYNSSYGVDITKGFTYSVFREDYDDKRPILDNEEDFNFNISPKDESCFDQHIDSAIEIYMNPKDFEKLGEMCETLFEFEGNYGEFKKMMKKYQPFFESNDYEIETPQKTTVNNNPKDCYWTIDCLDEEGYFILNITPKEYWKENKDIHTGGLEFNDEVEKFKLNQINNDYVLYDDKKTLLKLKDIYRIMSKFGFEFSNEIQKEYVLSSLNGERVEYREDDTDETFIERANLEYSEILSKLDKEEDVINANDLLWSIQLMKEDNELVITMNSKKYWEKERCISDYSNFDVDNFIMKGYTLNCISESSYVLSYLNNKDVKKLSEIKLVMDKSDFVYSYDMQNYLEHYNCLVNPSNYTTEKEYFDALKLEMGQ